MEDTIITNQPQPDAEMNVPAADGQEADKSVSLKDLLNTQLGKEFKDDATALKAVKDTFSYVGKVGKFAPKLDALQQKLGGENNLIKTMDDILNGQQAQPADNSNFVTRAELETERFFNTNPDYAQARPIIEAMAKTTGKPLNEVVADEAFKSLFDQAKAGKEIEASKSVMQSNPRLGQVTDKFTQAKEFRASGNDMAGAQAVAEAVIDSFPGLRQ